MRFKHSPASGVKSGVYVFVPMVSMLVIMLAVLLSLGSHDTIATILILILSLAFLVLVILYYIYGFYSLYYEIDDKGVTISWAFEKKSIPFDDILDARIVYITDASKLPGTRWPGISVGSFSCGEIGMVKLFATDLTHGIIAITTASGVTGISPMDTDRFISMLWMAMPGRITSAGQEISCPIPEPGPLKDIRYWIPVAVSMMVLMVIALVSYIGDTSDNRASIGPLLLSGMISVGMLDVIIPGVSAVTFITIVPMSCLFARTNKNAAIFMAMALIVLELILLISIYSLSFGGA